MTSNQAANMIREFQTKHQKKLRDNPLAVQEGKRWVLTDDGLEARDQLVAYDYETAASCFRQENIKSEWPSIAGVFARLQKAATKVGTSVEIPGELQQIGHGGVVSMDLRAYKGECYGLLELDTTLPGIWVIGVRIRGEDTYVPGAKYKPEWSFLPVTKYKFGLANKVSAHRAYELKIRWAQMDKSHEFDTDAPRHLWWKPVCDVVTNDALKGVPTGDVERMAGGLGHANEIRELEPRVRRVVLLNQAKQVMATESGGESH